MAVWNPSQYLKFGDHRLRPALDLMARLDLDTPRELWDLGCGTGQVTALLAARWPGARAHGLDSSPEMLGRARAIPGVDWIEGDLARWRPPAPVDLVFSNAVLHWLPDHGVLLPRLLAAVAPGGLLAVQMPRNFAAPSHRAMREAAEAGPWAPRLRPLLAAVGVAAPADYHRWLRPLAAALDIWEAEYLQVLEGDNPVVEWTMGTALKPLLDALEPAPRAGFLAEYARLVAAAYPPEPDGTTLFPFRRLFVVARR